MGKIDKYSEYVLLCPSPSQDHNEQPRHFSKSLFSDHGQQMDTLACTFTPRIPVCLAPLPASLLGLLAKIKV